MRWDFAVTWIFSLLLLGRETFLPLKLNQRLLSRMIIVMRRLMLLSLNGGCGRTRCVSKG
uniref:Protein ETHYLENE INSENSITIVE 3 n=1 Tax=Rhizophora mucronata TaxID=61149 RepID=A0A2P2JGS5_RHIMU